MKFLKLDPNTLEVLDIYNTCTAASESVNCSKQLITKSASEIHLRRTAKGFLWFALDEKTGLNRYGLLKNKEGNHLSLEEMIEILKKYNDCNGDNFVILKLDPDTLEVLDTYNSYKDIVANTKKKQIPFMRAAKGVYKGWTVDGYRWFALNKVTGLNHYDYSKYEEIQPKNGPYISLEELKEILIKTGVIKDVI